ncbi:glycoside hydrolase family 127 protein [Paenibacillus sp. CN-4]|uniref:glycoside hydrolase family 127 protein n=1 Tax=Paenibacillus nanchangensis TaxID=3348343 RepID=UPI00397E0004
MENTAAGITPNANTHDKPGTGINVRIRDEFWTHYIKLVQEVVIPYQYEALHDRIPGAEPSRAVSNFEIAAGRKQGEFGGFVFQDSDVAKWLEAVGYSLQLERDPELERRADELIALVGEAQQEDGYLNTYFTIKEPGQRWTNLNDCHEMYVAGHFIEAAVAYYEATGKRELLDIMCRMADHIDSVFGPEEGKLKGYDGHQEIELALVKLYGLTGEERYLKLSQFFIDQRGTQPHFFVEEWERRGRMTFYGGPTNKINLEYNQSHLPVREQKEAVGHSVRAVYMYTAMADLARLTGDSELEQACRRLWDNIQNKQLYITGGIGSTHHGEAFTFDYDLPNDTVYAETCASIGLIFFAKRMLNLSPDARFADVMERALYNNVLGSMAQDGKHYFYVNPLEVWPQACTCNPGKHHVKAQRQGWFGCACCPPNVARLLTSLNRYIYTVQGDTIYTDLYIGSELTADLPQGTVRVTQVTEYPWDGKIVMEIEPDQEKTFGLALRIPGWSGSGIKVNVNGEELTAGEESAQVRQGYMVIRRSWRQGDRVEVQLPMEPFRVYAHPQVRADARKVAVQRGPLVYCFESADNGVNLGALALKQDSPLTDAYDASLLGGAVTIGSRGSRLEESEAEQGLYTRSRPAVKEVPVQAVPYYMWGNRGDGEMRVWVEEE